MLRLLFYSNITLVFLFCAQLRAQSAVDTQVNTNADEVNADLNKTEKKQTLNFEDELIEGTALRPDLFAAFQKNNIKFKKLIKLRENFIPEMIRNAEDIQRLRGGR